MNIVSIALCGQVPIINGLIFHESEKRSQICSTDIVIPDNV